MPWMNDPPYKPAPPGMQQVRPPVDPHPADPWVVPPPGPLFGAMVPPPAAPASKAQTEPVPAPAKKAPNYKAPPEGMDTLPGPNDPRSRVIEYPGREEWERRRLARAAAAAAVAAEYGTRGTADETGWEDA